MKPTTAATCPLPHSPPVSTSKDKQTSFHGHDVSQEPTCWCRSSSSAVVQVVCCFVKYRSRTSFTLRTPLVVAATSQEGTQPGEKEEPQAAQEFKVLLPFVLVYSRVPPGMAAEELEGFWPFFVLFGNPSWALGLFGWGGSGREECEGRS